MHTQRTPRHRTRRFAVSIFLAALAAAVVVQAAAAMLDSSAVTGGGDAKNQLPFTRVVSASSDKSDVVSRYLASHGITGRLAAEPKNELPFTQPATASVAPVSGKAQAEAMNEQLVTPQFQASSQGAALQLRRDGRLAQVVQTTSSSSGVDWTLIAAIAGALAAIGAGTAAGMVVRHRVPRTA